MSHPSEFDGHPYQYVKNPPTYRGFCKRVIDGDTYDIFLDLGLRKYAFETIRLRGFDTPEIFHPRNAAELEHGKAAAARAAELLEGQQVMITTHRDVETYGRFVADVFYYPLASGTATPRVPVSIAATLDAEGFRKRATY